MAATLTLPFAVVERWPAGLNELVARLSILALTPSGEEEISACSVLNGRRCSATKAQVCAPTLALCDRRVRIAMTPGADSLNVVTAAAVALDRFRV